jgi:mannosyltransferase
VAEHLELRHPTAITVGATLASLAAGLWGLSSRGWSGDEAFSQQLASLPTGDLLALLGEREANGLLHTVLLHGWVQVDDGLWWVRFLSVLLVAGAVPVVALLGRRCASPTVGALAGVLLALHAYAVQYAQEARGYGLLILLTAASALLLVRALERPSWWRLAAWALVTGLLGWAHLFGFLVVAAELLSLLLRRGLPTPRRLWVGAAGIAVLAGPVAWLLADQSSNGQIDWIDDTGAHVVASTFSLVAGDFGLALLACVAAVCTVALLDLWRRRRALDEARWSILLLLLMVAVPFVVAAPVTLLHPLWEPRYFVEVIPPLVVLTALGLVRMPRRWGLALLAAILVLQVAGLHRWLTDPHPSNLADAVDVIGEEGEPASPAADGLLVAPLGLRLPLGLHLDEDDGVAGELERISPRPPWIGLDVPETATVADLDGRSSVWLVRFAPSDALQPDDVEQIGEVEEVLADAGFEPVDEGVELQGLLVRRYER